MKYNTIKFTNIDDEVFIGRFDGDDYKVEIKEERYFPSFLSQHFEIQLLQKMFSKVAKSSKIRYKDFIKDLDILDKELITITSTTDDSIKSQVSLHEQQMKAKLFEDNREQRSKVIEAMNISKEDDR